MVVAVVFLGLLLDARILRPLRELCAGVHAARDAAAAPLVPVRRADEIGYLASTFNETVAVMRDHRDHLESLVARRTAQLEESRAELIHRESLSAAGRLAAGLAHEIGNPLSAISTLCQYVLRKRRDDDLVTEQLTLVESQVRRLAELTGRMMDLARTAPPDIGAVDVNSLVATACDLARMDKRLGGRQLALCLEPDLPLARAHADIVIPAVLNLVLNAADAGAGAGPAPITAETGREGDRVVVRIIDHFGGVPPGLERTIFEPFFTTRADCGGCGLGLSVTTSLLRSIGGDLALRNRPGIGATFVISLEPCQGQPT
jgi:C4-dicarboxylate-specific signal transduction histidine kinase